MAATGHQIRSDVNQKKENLPLVYFAVPTDHRVKTKESEKLNKYLDLARERKNIYMKVKVITFVVGTLWTFPKNLRERDWRNCKSGGAGQNHPDYRTAEIGKNTGKSQGNLRKIGVP